MKGLVLFKLLNRQEFCEPTLFALDLEECSSCPGSNLTHGSLLKQELPLTFVAAAERLPPDCEEGFVVCPVCITDIL